MVSLSDGLEIFAVAIGFAVQGETEFTDKLLGNVGGLKVGKVFFGVVFGGFCGARSTEIGVFLDNGETEIAKAEKVALVIFSGFLRTAAFDFEMLDKIANQFGDIHKYIIA